MSTFRKIYVYIIHNLQMMHIYIYMFRHSMPHIRDRIVFIAHIWACSHQAHVIQYDGINASRHAQSIMRSECSNDHKRTIRELHRVLNNIEVKEGNSTICRPIHARLSVQLGTRHIYISSSGNLVETVELRNILYSARECPEEIV